MNPNTGAIYPDLVSAVEAGEDPHDIVEVTGEVEALAQAAEAIEARAKAMGRHQPGTVPSARQLRRQLEREGR